jgi:hypothetical protein
MRKRRSVYAQFQDKVDYTECGKRVKESKRLLNEANETAHRYELKYNENERRQDLQNHDTYQSCAKLRDALQLQYDQAKFFQDRGKLVDDELYLISLDVMHQSSEVAQLEKETKPSHIKLRIEEHRKLLDRRAIANANFGNAVCELTKANENPLAKACDLYIDRSKKRIKAYDDRLLVFKKGIADAREAFAAKRQRTFESIVGSDMPQGEETNSMCDAAMGCESASFVRHFWQVPLFP